MIVAFEPAFRMIGLMFAGACTIGAVIGIFTRGQDRKLVDQSTSIDAIRQLDWRRFERFMCEAFRRQGYVAQTTGPGPDGGVDIRLSRDGQIFLVQCKQWRSRKVGVRQVRELAGVVSAESATGGIFVCSGAYTREAESFAAVSGIRLVGSLELAEMLRLCPEEDQAPSSSTSCPKCGQELVRRLARRGANAGAEFLGCSGFPRCRHTEAVMQRAPSSL